MDDITELPSIDTTPGPAASHRPPRATIDATAFLIVCVSLCFLVIAGYGIWTFTRAATSHIDRTAAEADKAALELQKALNEAAKLQLELEKAARE